MSNSKSKLGTHIIDCKAVNCSFNHGGSCRTIGINVGGPEPLCDTFITTDTKSGILNTTARVGACKVQTCMHNMLLECVAEGIRVAFKDNQALCDSYQMQV